jgi:plastocyanin
MRAWEGGALVTALAVLGCVMMVHHDASTEVLEQNREMVALLVQENRDAAVELRHARAELTAAREKIETMESGFNAQIRALQTAAEPDESAAQGSHRSLQQDTCLNSDEVAFSAMQSAYSVSKAFDEFSKQVLPGLLAKSAGGESNTCRCVICADTPKGGPLCLPWAGGPAPVPCDCLGTQASKSIRSTSFPSSRTCVGVPDQGYNDAGSRQTFPVKKNDPPCCRREWQEAVSVHQIPGTTRYSQNEFTLKICGQISFNWLPGKLENVEQVDAKGVMIRGGIGSGGPVITRNQFNVTFKKPGTYYLQSQIHTTLAVKVRVVQCDYCTVTAGYDGSQPRSLAVALSSQSPGSYNLRIADHASLGAPRVHMHACTRLLHVFFSLLASHPCQTRADVVQVP